MILVFAQISFWKRRLLSIGWHGAVVRTCLGLSFFCGGIIRHVDKLFTGTLKYAIPLVLQKSVWRRCLENFEFLKSRTLKDLFLVALSDLSRLNDFNYHASIFVSSPTQRLTQVLLFIKSIVPVSEILPGLPLNTQDFGWQIVLFLKDALLNLMKQRNALGKLDKRSARSRTKRGKQQKTRFLT